MKVPPRRVSDHATMNEKASHRLNSNHVGSSSQRQRDRSQSKMVFVCQRAERWQNVLKKERFKMKKTIALAAVVAAAGLANADTMVIDVSGIQSWGFAGDAQNEFLNVLVGASASITNIAWDVNLTTLGISWAEENTMGFFGNSEEVLPGFGDGFTVTNMNYSGSQASAIVLGADGMLDIEFYETGWDDNAGDVDSLYESGSTITLSGTGFVPTPGSLAVLGLGGLVAGRRRR